MARSMLSLGMLCERAVVTAVRRRGLALTSPPPMRAATVISLMSLVKILPRLESLSAFLCLIVLHLEWPDMGFPFPVTRCASLGGSKTGAQNLVDAESDGWPIVTIPSATK